MARDGTLRSSQYPSSNIKYLEPLHLKPLHLKPLHLKPLHLKPLYLKPLYLKPLHLKPLYLSPFAGPFKNRAIFGSQANTSAILSAPLTFLDNRGWG